MKIKVNKDLHVEVVETDTVWSVKWKIYHESLWKLSERLLPPDDQKLVILLDGNETELCECERTLSSYSIHEGSQIACKCKIPHGEKCFRSTVGIFRKTTKVLELVKVTQVLGAPQVSHHFHEVQSVQLMSFWWGQRRRNPIDYRLTDHMVEHLVNLRKLILYQNNDFGDEGAIKIAERLEEHHSMRELHLVRCGITSRGAVRIGEMLEKKSHLETLILWGNRYLGNEGAIRIAKALEKNTSLKILNLSQCGIASEGGKKIGEMLEENVTLVQLELQGNGNIGEEGGIRIAEALKKNTSLKILLWDGCFMTEETRNSIEVFLRRNCECQKK